MTVKEAIAYSVEALKEITEEAENEARILVSHLCGDSMGSLAFSSKSIDKIKLDAMLKERKEGRPLQYIIGKWWFYKGEFFVGEGVLIPRQDTETLVEVATELLRNKENPSVADLCAGSGCIGISIAADFPNASVTAVEKYQKAYSYLEKNIAHNGTKNVTPVLADVTEKQFGSYDLIVSNPPYITAEDMKMLSNEVKKEPETALYGGEDGLYFYRRITELWKTSLKPNGILAFEVGINEADAVGRILARNRFKNITVRKDLCGVQRVVFGTVGNI